MVNPRFFVVATVLVAALVPACGNGSETTSPSPSASETVTPTPSETTSAPSPTPSASEPSTPSASALDLEDGKHPAFIVGVDVADRTITIDVVQWFVGDAAASAAAEDGSEEVPPPNDYWIRNENPRLRTLPVPVGTKITTNVLTGAESGDVSKDVRVSLRKLASLDGLETALFWITVDNGEAVRISEQYLP